MVAVAAGDKPNERVNDKPTDETIRRGQFAEEWLHNILAAKLGNKKSYSKITLEINIQGGEIPGAVKLNDEVHFK